jgi:hypothetical protein
MIMNRLNETEPGEVALEFFSNETQEFSSIDSAIFSDEINDILYSAIELVTHRPELVNLEQIKDLTDIEDGLDEDGREAQKRLSKAVLALAMKGLDKPARKNRAVEDESGLGR